LGEREKSMGDETITFCWDTTLGHLFIEKEKD
jgi:hypothetical protein